MNIEKIFNHPHILLQYISYGVISIILLLVIISFFKSSKIKSPIKQGFRGILLPTFQSSLAINLLSLNTMVRGVLIIGGAGSGKTKSLIEPIIRKTISEGYSGIIYDFKFPVLANYVYTCSLDTMNDVSFFYVNFNDVSRSNRFNIFGVVNSSAHAKEFASTFLVNLLPETIKNSDFFLRTATAMLSASILYFNKHLPRKCTLPHIISFLLLPNTEKIVELLSTDYETADLIAPVRSGLNSEKQTAGVISTLQNALSACATKEIFWVLSGNDFDLDLNNKKSPKMLVIGNDATLIESLSPIISLTITVASKLMNKPDKEKSIILLDEGPTLFIPNFDNIPATGRENKIATVFCAQDLSQMEEKYGDKKAESLVSNLGNQFFGKTGNPISAEKIAKRFGYEEVIFESKSESYSINKNSSGSSLSFQQRNRVGVDKLFKLKPGEFIGTSTNGEMFKARFKFTKSPIIPLFPFKKVNEKSIIENYLKIKKEVSEIIPKEL